MSGPGTTTEPAPRVRTVQAPAGDAVSREPEPAPREAVPYEVPYSDALERLLRRATWIGQTDDATPGASVTSVFLALVAGDDELSRWVQDKLPWLGPSLDDVIRSWNAPPGFDRGR